MMGGGGRPRAFRCSHDDVNWPPATQFETCPICGEATWETDERPLDPAGVSKLIGEVKTRNDRRAAFEKFYEDEWLPRQVDAMLASLDEEGPPEVVENEAAGA
jgi:hypothetical protein